MGRPAQNAKYDQNRAMKGNAHLGLAVGLSPLRTATTSVEARARLVRDAGLSRVTMSAAETGMRPRDLSRSARRDIAAQLRKGGVSCIGVELWIPQRHFAEGEHQQRAVDALTDAIRYAAEMSELTDGAAALHTSLPLATDEDSSEQLPTVIHPCTRAVLDDAASHGVDVIDHGVFGTSDQGMSAGCSIGIDCSLEVMRASDPVDKLLHHSSRVRSLRLSDAVGGSRVRIGSGDLDMFKLIITWSTLREKPALVIDLRGIESPEIALTATIDAYESMLPPGGL